MRLVSDATAEQTSHLNQQLADAYMRQLRSVSNAKHRICVFYWMGLRSLSPYELRWQSKDARNKIVDATLFDNRKTEQRLQNRFARRVNSYDVFITFDYYTSLIK